MKILIFNNKLELAAAFGVPVFTIATIVKEPGWQVKLNNIVSGFLTNPSNEPIASKYPDAQAAFAIAGLFVVAYLVLRQKK